MFQVKYLLAERDYEAILPDAFFIDLIFKGCQNFLFLTCISKWISSVY